MERILIVTVNWLGDAILTTPVFRALKKKFPASYIGVMAVERVAEVYRDNPYIDEVIIFNEKNAHRSLSAKIKFIKFLKDRNFNMAFLIHRSFSRALICFFAGIKRRFGYKRHKNLFILTDKINPPVGLVHRQDYYLYLFEKSGITINERLPVFFVPNKERDDIGKLLDPISKKHPFIVGINPSANWLPKRWPQEYVATLSDRLINDLNCAVVFIGAEKENDIIQDIIQKMQCCPYNFCGKTTLKELGALIAKMNLFISNDSGPAHLSASLKIPTLVLFGPTSEKITSPRGNLVKIIRKEVNCKIPCYKINCPDNICMKKISVDEVFLEAKNILLRKDI
jgi:heptosyltransferase-2